MNSDRLVIINGRRWGVKGQQNRRPLTKHVLVFAVRLALATGHRHSTFPVRPADLN
jgi:hypothetical protein